MTDEKPMPKFLVEDLVRYARRQAPREVCGFIRPEWYGVTIMENIAKEDNRFEIDNEALLRFYAECPRPIGFFHSHPSGRAMPSDADVMYAPRDMRYWIITLDSIYEWDMENDPPQLLATTGKILASPDAEGRPPLGRRDQKTPEQGG